MERIRSTIRVQACTRGMLTRKVMRKGNKLLAQVNFADKKARQSAFLIQAMTRGFLIRFFLRTKKYSIKQLREKLDYLNREKLNTKLQSLHLHDEDSKLKKQSQDIHKLYSGLMEAHFGKRSNHRKSIAMDVIRSF